jgi:hypothetical protein
MPPPLPLPTPLPSAPLGSGSDKPAASASTRLPPQPASKGPSVISYDEQEYVCQSTDTWESLSKQFFLGTDRYARALQRHNQNHARASDPMSRTGKVQPGERIFIPQSYILEEKYADAIPHPAVAPASATMPATSTSPGSSPSVPPPPPANSSAPPRSQ